MNDRPPKTDGAAQEAPSGARLIGKPTPQITAADKVTGRAMFADDIRIQNPLDIKILRSPAASARIASIDTTEALAMPGVRGVIVGSDFSGTFGVLPISRDEPPLAVGRVRYVGEPVAAVAADSERIATRALGRIRVEYADTKPILAASQGLRDVDSPDDLIHPELGRSNNVHKHVEQAFGDVDGALKESSIVVQRRFEFAPVTHAFTEPHATQVELDGTGAITVYSATQVPHYLHRALSELMEIPMHRIRVVKPHLGGGFGGKSDPFPHEFIAVKLALVTGRNVRIAFEREEVFFSHHGRHATTLDMRLGLDADGAITGLGADVVIDGGAYGSFGVVTTYYNGVLLQGPYRIPNFTFQCDRVYTNKPMNGAMRGHGGVNPRFAAEVVLDEAFTEAGVDPCDGRLRLFHEANSLLINEFRVTSVDIANGLERAIAESGWREKYGKLPYGKGIGVAAGFFISGSALAIHWDGIPQSTVRLTIDFDGGVTLYSGASDIGQGSDTMLAQMAAEVLGVPLDMLTVITADTRLAPIDYGSYSSRVTFMAGNAARNAAIRIRRELVETVAEMLGVEAPPVADPGEPESFFRQGGRAPDFSSDYLGPNPDYADGFDFVDGTIVAPDGQTVAWLEAVREAMKGRGALQSRGNYISPKMGGSFRGAGAGLSPAYSYTAYITEVTVDPDTGFVKVDRVTAAHDCGTPLNPLIVEGQIEGSIHMGLGQALMERMDYDARGALSNGSFLEYKIPSPFEQPEICIVPCGVADNEGPFGAKEAGEGPLAPLSPSISNAIYDAVGVRMRALPMTPDKVLGAIRAAGRS